MVRIQINHCSKNELLTIPFLKESLAEYILDLRYDLVNLTPDSLWDALVSYVRYPEDYIDCFDFTPWNPTLRLNPNYDANPHPPTPILEEGGCTARRSPVTQKVYHEVRRRPPAHAEVMQRPPARAEASRRLHVPAEKHWIPEPTEVHAKADRAWHPPVMEDCRGSHRSPPKLYKTDRDSQDHGYHSYSTRHSPDHGYYYSHSVRDSWNNSYYSPPIRHSLDHKYHSHSARYDYSSRDFRDHSYHSHSTTDDYLSRNSKDHRYYSHIKHDDIYLPRDKGRNDYYKQDQVDFPSLLDSLSFSGKGSWKVFHSKFEQYADACGLNSNQKKKQLCCNLDREASDYSALLLTIAPDLDYLGLVQRLKKRFTFPDSDTELSRMQFHCAQQTSEESNVDWADRLLTLEAHAFPDFPDNLVNSHIVRKFCQDCYDKEAGQYALDNDPQDLIDAFDLMSFYRRGIHPHRAKIKSEVCVQVNSTTNSSTQDVSLTQQPPSVQEDRDLLAEMKVETDSKQTRTVQDSVDSMQSPIQDLYSVVSENITKQPRDLVSSSEAIPNFPCRSVSKTSAGETCFTCGQSGHFRKNCPEREPNIFVSLFSSVVDNQQDFRKVYSSLSPEIESQTVDNSCSKPKTVDSCKTVVIPCSSYKTVNGDLMMPCSKCQTEDVGLDFVCSSCKASSVNSTVNSSLSLTQEDGITSPEDHMHGHCKSLQAQGESTPSHLPIHDALISFSPWREVRHLSKVGNPHPLLFCPWLLPPWPPPQDYIPVDTCTSQLIA